jgi:soluble lytic murein transglycosylase-like protein
VIRPVLALSEKHQVDPFWVLSVMWTESNFRFEVTSNKGAKGLMQVMPSTHAALLETMRKDGVRFESDKGDEYLASTYPVAYQRLGYPGLVRKLRNLEVGIYYLKTLLQQFEHNHFHATVAYNMGPSWTRVRLRNNQPVGKRNRYLSKVMKAYFHITKNLSHNANVSYISRTYWVARSARAT